MLDAFISMVVKQLEFQDAPRRECIWIKWTRLERAMLFEGIDGENQLSLSLLT